MTSTFRVEPLNLSTHDRTQFRSGEPTLDDWVRRFAGQAARRDRARTYVVCDGPRVIGYYSVCAFQVERDVAPPRVRVGGHQLSAILLGRLAVDQNAQGVGLGRWLLFDALSLAASVAERIGARVVVVHAVHERAAAFYLRYGFVRFDSQRLSLYLPMQDVRATLAAAEGRRLCAHNVRTLGGGRSPMNETGHEVRRSERINLRLEPETDELLRAAARVERKSLSAFMVESALDRARRVMDAERRLLLSSREFDRVLGELDRPPQVIPPLLELAQRASHTERNGSRKPSARSRRRTY